MRKGIPALLLCALLLTGCKVTPAAVPPATVLSAEPPNLAAGTWMRLSANYVHVSNTNALLDSLPIPDTYEGKTYEEWVEEIYEPGDVGRLSWADNPMLSPNGKYAVYHAGKGSVAPGGYYGTSVFLLNVETGEERIILKREEFENCYPLHWADDETVICAAGAGDAIRYFLCKLSGEVIPMDLRGDGMKYTVAFRDNWFVYRNILQGSDEDGEVVVAYIEDNKVVEYKQYDAARYHLMEVFDLDPDCKRLAFTQRLDVWKPERDIVLWDFESDTFHTVPNPDVAGADVVGAISLWWDGPYLRADTRVTVGADSHNELWLYNCRDITPSEDEIRTVRDATAGPYRYAAAPGETIEEVALRMLIGPMDGLKRPENRRMFVVADYVLGESEILWDEDGQCWYVTADVEVLYSGVVSPIGPQDAASGQYWPVDFGRRKITRDGEMYTMELSVV